MKTPKIVVVGSLNMDFVVNAPRIPVPGETVSGAGQLETIPGGKGANQAFAAKAMGAEVTMIGRVGSDGFGEVLLDNLNRVGVNVERVGRDVQSSSGIAIIVIDKNGQNIIVVSSGANETLTAEHITAAEDSIASADAVIMQLETPTSATLQACRLARKHNVKTVFNPAPARPIDDELLTQVDVIIPNETETVTFAGVSPVEEAGRERAAKYFFDKNVGSVVITLGENGAYVASKERGNVVPPFKVATVDATAAGDAFVAGYTVATAEGKSPIEAARFGNAAGALATTIRGAQPSLPTRIRIDKIIREQRL